MVCVNSTAFTDSTSYNSSIRTIDVANIAPNYRGFSDAIRVGRYAYLSPYANASHSYVGTIIRIYLGLVDIGTTLINLQLNNLPISSIVETLDLKNINVNYAGYSSLFTAGQYIYFVPYRNSNILFNGQRGHGNFIQLDMNNFDPSGITSLDLTITTRNQIPSFADLNLRGYSYGFACKFVLLCV